MSARAEQLVLEYLSRVADEARGVLRSDERLRFVSRIRASIEQQRHGASELDEVRRVLARFGDPKVLVERERRRLDETSQQAGAEGTATDSASARAAAPAADPRPPRGPAADRPPLRGRAADPAPPRGPAVDPPPPLRGWVPGKAAVPRPSASPAADASATVHAHASGRLRMWRPPGERPTVSTGRVRSSPSTSHTAFDLLSTTRRFRVAALAVMLLGPGGVLLPFPLWLIGAAAAMTSWAWNRPEKLIGLAGPLIVVLAGVGVIGALNKNPSITVDLHAYIAAAHAHGRVLMGVGAMAGALFLGARLVRRYRAVMRRSANG